MSDLVGNPEDRFSRVAAHILISCMILLFPVRLLLYFIIMLFVWKPHPMDWPIQCDTSVEVLIVLCFECLCCLHILCTF